MFYVGKIKKVNYNLIKITQNALYNSIKYIKPNENLNIIGSKIEEYAKKHNLSVIKEYCGHGVGIKLHEDPYVFHYNNKNEKIKIKENMIFTIEPILTLGNGKTKIDKDGWTILNKDNSLSAQWEHTILVLKNGCEILTLRDEELL